MVNFRDPTEIAQDQCKYAFSTENVSSGSPPLDSGGYEALARYGWSLHVNLSGHVDCPLRTVTVHLQVGVRHHSRL